jgi:hypothetical protein
VKAVPIGGILAGFSVPVEQVSISPESWCFAFAESADTLFANGTTSSEAIKINSSKPVRDLPVKAAGTTDPIGALPRNPTIKRADSRLRHFTELKHRWQMKTVVNVLKRALRHGANQVSSRAEGVHRPCSV